MLELTEEETNTMYDYAALAKDNSVSPDLPQYIMGTDNVRVALRKAKNLGMDDAVDEELSCENTDEEWGGCLMSKNMIYHGSNVAVSNPRILINGYYKDFGYGFYCTNIEKQAKRWALTKKGASIVNKYSYIENKNLKTLCFREMTEEWLEFVVACRKGKEHDYDIVEGPMADDQIWDYVEDYISGKISKTAFWELVKFKYPTHQIVFCTEAALSVLTFEGSVTL